MPKGYEKGCSMRFASLRIGCSRRRWRPRPVWPRLFLSHSAFELWRPRLICSRMESTESSSRARHSLMLSGRGIIIRRWFHQCFGPRARWCSVHFTGFELSTHWCAVALMSLRLAVVSVLSGFRRGSLLPVARLLLRQIAQPRVHLEEDSL